MARDRWHYQVRTALQKEGWTITDDPYLIRVPEVPYQIDLGAERIIAAEKGAEKIAIEIKGFPDLSFHHQFHAAVGQYVNYLANMKTYEPDRALYLAVPEIVYRTYFDLRAVRTSIEHLSLKYLVFDPESETILLWNPS